MRQSLLVAALVAIEVAFLLAAAFLWPRPKPFPPDAVLVPLDHIPPDACFELFGPGPCRPHGGMPTTGWTDAVAGPAPTEFRSK